MSKAALAGGFDQNPVSRCLQEYSSAATMNGQ
jgi:hypothetical protein